MAYSPVELNKLVCKRLVAVEGDTVAVPRDHSTLAGKTVLVSCKQLFSCYKLVVVMFVGTLTARGVWAQFQLLVTIDGSHLQTPISQKCFFGVIINGECVFNTKNRGCSRPSSLIF